MKKFELSLLIGLIITIIFTSFTTFGKESVQIRESVLRLHILANSDSEQDQDLKLKVRDRILSSADELFYNVDSKENAVDAAIAKSSWIEAIAQDEVIQNGYDYDVSVEICEMYFDTRYYKDLTMPAGRYDALRITIGEAEGENWWCVMYPPLCLPLATEPQSIDDELTEQQQEIVEGEVTYTAQFAFVEFFESIFDKISSFFS